MYVQRGSPAGVRSVPAFERAEGRCLKRRCVFGCQKPSAEFIRSNKLRVNVMFCVRDGECREFGNTAWPDRALTERAAKGATAGAASPPVRLTRREFLPQPLAIRCAGQRQVDPPGCEQ